STTLFLSHVTFLENLDYYYETDDYIFVHAGVDPKRTVEDTDPYDLVWIRDEFHQNYSGTKTVVFGHTPTPMLNNSYSDHTVYFGDNNIIGIDGGAVFGGQLNCLELPSKKVYSITGYHILLEKPILLKLPLKEQHRALFTYPITYSDGLSKSQNLLCIGGRHHRYIILTYWTDCLRSW